MSHGDGHHTHRHGDHDHVVEDYSSRKHPEFIVLDIGDGVGALIIYTDPDMHGVEIEISPASEDGRRSHKQVLERNIDQDPAFTAVFDGLPAGGYTLWVEGIARARGVSIEASAVAELDWRVADVGALSTAPVSRPR
jgi:SAM-dependent methyltransferase